MISFALFLVFYFLILILVNLIVLCKHDIILMMKRYYSVTSILLALQAGLTAQGGKKHGKKSSLQW